MDPWAWARARTNLRRGEGEVWVSDGPIWVQALLDTFLIMYVGLRFIIYTYIYIYVFLAIYIVAQGPNVV
jgi:hypothetical protein